MIERFSSLVRNFWWGQLIIDLLIIIPITLLITVGLLKGGVEVSPLVMLAAAICLAFLKQFLHWGLTDMNPVEWPAPPASDEIPEGLRADAGLRRMEDQLQALARPEPSPLATQRFTETITQQLRLKRQADPSAARQHLSKELADYYEAALADPNHPRRLSRSQINRYLQELQLL